MSWYSPQSPTRILPSPALTHCISTVVILIAVLSQSTRLLADTLRVPEDYPSIQAGIDAAEFGDTVTVSAGTYVGSIRLKPGIIVKSAGDDTPGECGLLRAEKTILHGSGEDATAAGVAMAENSTLDGFTITRVGTYDEERWNKHHQTQGESQAKEPIGAPGVPGIEILGITDCTVSNNIVHHIGYTGIAITGVNGKRVAPHVFRNICFRNMGGGIGSMRSSCAVIEGNTCYENFYAGIGHENASPLVLNNTCYNNIRAGIGISEGASPIVRGNRCYQNRRAGIGIRTGESTSPIVEDNDCFENDMAGIGTRDAATPIIRNNRCYKNALAGIGSRTGSRPLIVGNECYENGMSGVGSETEARPIVVENDCRENSTVGIGIEKNSQAVLVRNRCHENKLVAVGIRNGSEALLYGNQLQRTGGMPPLLAIREGSSAVAMKNTLEGGGVAGILLQGNATILENRLAGAGPRAVGPPNYAIWIQGDSRVTVDKNQSSRWRHGIFAQDANQVTITNNTISEFLKAAIVVKGAKLPAQVYGNTAISNGNNEQAVQISGPQGLVTGNSIKQLPTDQ